MEFFDDYEAGAPTIYLAESVEECTAFSTEMKPHAVDDFMRLIDRQLDRTFPDN